MKKLLFVFIGLLTISGCEDIPQVEKPEQLLDEEKYIDIFYELELLRVYQNRGASSVVIDSLYLEVFKKHDTDTAFFRKSHEFYQTQLMDQKERADTAISKMRRELKLFEKPDSLKLQEKDSTKE